MVQIGPIDLPRWAIIGLFGGVAFYLMDAGKLTANYTMMGSSWPLQDMALGLFVLAIGFGIMYQVQNL